MTWQQDMAWRIQGGMPIHVSPFVTADFAAVVNYTPGNGMLVMHPLSYTTLIAYTSHRYVSNGPCGLVKHRTRQKAMRMTGRGSCWIVSPKGRVLARNHSPFVTPTR